MPTFVIGDIHGSHKGLKQCLKKSGFDYAKDRLIVLGDVCDGYPETRACVEELLTMRNCDYIVGNHDLWVLDWALSGKREDVWVQQGGAATIASYGGEAMPKAHVDFLEQAYAWIEFDNKIFVHGGLDHTKSMDEQNMPTLVWDRDLLANAQKKHQTDPAFKFADYDEIYIGHTSTEFFDSLKPLNFCNVWALDTGAGGSGKLSIMDIATKEVWQSDLSSSLYPA